MPTDELQLTPDDLRVLRERGIEPAEAERQLALLREPPAPLRLARACTVGDGLEQIGGERRGELLELASEAAASGRITKFVPASGAATRMFGDLVGESDAGRAGRERLFAERERFAFATELAAAVASSGEPLDDPATWASVLLADEGLAYASLPKALIAFHRYGSEARTAFEEHLVEGATLAGGGGPIGLHFTVSGEHLQLFEAALDAARVKLGPEVATRLEVGFSTQSAATDTISVDTDLRPFRTSGGELLLRPSGHGALLGNLENAGGDLVVIKNIDNIQPQRRHEEIVEWKRLLVGLLIERQRSLAEVALEIDRGEIDGESAARTVAGLLGLSAPRGEAAAGWARDRIDRPLRVCGMVRNEGEPGGGPYWVESPAGEIDRQIVESSQVDFESPEQREIWSGATHFNPVDLVCAMRRPDGKPYRLAAYVDPATAFVSDKQHEGRALRSLERPGLWNGSMAGWNTLFVEVPSFTFAPVKTVFDLLRPEHLPATA